jgi:ribonuclease G
LVLVPFSDKVSLSSRIKGEKERNRLKRLMQSIQPPGFGIIVRTVAEDKGSADLHSDLEELVARWGELHKNLRNAKPGKRVLGEVNKTSAVLRDILNADIKTIHVNDPRSADEVKEFLVGSKSGDEGMVKLHRTKDLFNDMSIHRQIKAAFGRQVNLKSGSYLVLEQTEAMHVIDVNSGGRKKGASSQEENALITNLDVVPEIARLLRLRDMGGIIAIDFIDMAKREHNKQLTDAMKEAMKRDKAKHNIMSPSRFGVMEMTRQRVREVADVATQDACPSCNGSGKIQASILITDKIERSLQYLAEGEGRKTLNLVVHPMLEAYLLQGWWWQTIKRGWEKKFGLKLTVDSNSSMEIMEFHIFNSLGEEVTLD